MGLFHLEKVFGIKIRESADDGSDFSNPDTDYRMLFLGEDGDLHLKDSSGTVTDIGGGAAPTFVGCRVYNSTTQTIGTGSFTAVTFDSEEYDTDSLHSTVSNTGRLTASATGKWNVTAGVTWDTNATNNRYLLLRVNGTTYVRGTIRQDLGQSGRASQNITSGPIALSATDYVEVLVYQDSGGDRDIGDASTVYYKSTASFWQVG